MSDSSDDLTAAYLAGFHKRDDEIERLRNEKAMLLTAKKVEIVTPPLPESELVDALRRMLDDQVVENARLRADRDSWAQQADDRVKDCEQFIAEIERLRTELAGADRIANGWAKQNVELRRLLRFFFENVPVKYHERYADVMNQTKEILGHHE